MAVRPVVALPERVLQVPTQAILDIDEDARQLGIDLVDTMRVSPGCVGLAANQIDVPLRAFCVDVTGHKKAKSCAGLIVLFNPELVAASEPKLGREGCMSVPDLTGDVARATKITVRGQDPNGDWQTIEADAFEARALLHELDHLDGLLFLDRVDGPGGVFPRKVYR